MTREQAQRLLDNIEILSAYVEEKTIQFRMPNSIEWTDCVGGPDPHMDRYAIYRIKPSPSYRPWTPEEVPVGALFKSQFGMEFIIMGRIGMYPNSIEISAINTVRGGWQSFTIDNHCTYSLDHGKTWQPCGVLIP